MVCRQCGTNNERGFKFCVKCGSNLENPQEVNYEQVDMGGYHTEEEFSDNKTGFTFGSGTFVIRDTAPSDAASDMYTADELNDSDEEFDFSMYDEPYIPKLDADRVSMPGQQPKQNQNMQGMPQMNMPNQQANRNYGMQGMPQMNMPNQQANRNYGMQGMPQMNMPAQPQKNANQNVPQMNMPVPSQKNANQGMQQMYNQPVMYGQPQIIGYDQSGMPIYGQPMMYGQPQIIGYDQNGMPIYGQPVMYGQPQIMGYDQSGMPIYGQPVMYGQPQIMGYDSKGMPIYSQLVQPAPQSAQPQNNQKPANELPQLGVSQNPPKPEKTETKKKSNADFWDFFDEGKEKKHESTDDFFGKSSHKNNDDMGDLSTDNLDFSKLKRNEKKKVDYMGDTPFVDASKLRQNDADKFNKFYMKQTEVVDASNLQAKKQEKQQDIMGVTKEVDANKLAAAEKYKTQIKMYTTADVNADDLEAYTPEHKKALMAEADKAVEALPKKKEAYIDDLDKIELPDYMQAKKTSKEEKAEIPSLPEVGIE
ncbi:MAG: hypothetical protein IKS03_04985 [Ruminococcus sp.]|nr:hypothetical protein [Ruminococcus sp.]